MKRKKIWKWKPTVFSAAVLAVLIGVGVGFLGKNEKNPLLNEQNAITLYMEIQAGEEPVFKTENFFPEEDMEYSLVSYDTEGLDFREPGIYEIPVLYDGNSTNCVVRLNVCGEETENTAASGHTLSAAE